MMNVTPARLKGAVSTVCREIELRLEQQPAIQLDEVLLWRELTCCVLSSQVPYDLALSAADQIHANGIFSGQEERSTEEVYALLLDVLSGSFVVGQSSRKYRFPQLRSRQLTLCWDAVRREGGLSGLLTNVGDAYELRRWLVVNAPGVGPKQASMFLRNAGITYKLAILDRHVLRYMDLVGLDVSPPIHSTNLRRYRDRELALEAHANEAGHRLGLLDWAIWIVMRVAGVGVQMSQKR